MKEGRETKRVTKGVMEEGRESNGGREGDKKSNEGSNGVMEGGRKGEELWWIELNGMLSNNAVSGLMQSHLRVFSILAHIQHA